MANILRFGELLKRQQESERKAAEKEKQKANQEAQVATSSRDADQPPGQQKSSKKDSASKSPSEAQPNKPANANASPADAQQDNGPKQEGTPPEQRADRPSAARIVAYSDSDSDEEPLVKRRKAREKAEAAAKGEDGLESGPGLGPVNARQGLKAISQQKIIQARQQAATGARRMKNGINLDLLMKVCLHYARLAVYHGMPELPFPNFLPSGSVAFPPANKCKPACVV